MLSFHQKTWKTITNDSRRFSFLSHSRLISGRMTNVRKRRTAGYDRHISWLLLILMNNFQFLFIEVKRRTDGSELWKLERYETCRLQGPEVGERVWIRNHLNIHKYPFVRAKQRRYHSFENGKINIINDIRFIIVFVLCFGCVSFYQAAATYRDGIRVQKSHSSGICMTSTTWY